MRVSVFARSKLPLEAVVLASEVSPDATGEVA